MKNEIPQPEPSEEAAIWESLSEEARRVAMIIPLITPRFPSFDLNADLEYIFEITQSEVGSREELAVALDELCERGVLGKDGENYVVRNLQFSRYVLTEVAGWDEEVDGDDSQV